MPPIGAQGPKCAVGFPLQLVALDGGIRGGRCRHRLGSILRSELTLSSIPEGRAL